MAIPSNIQLHVVTPDHSHSYEVDEVVLPGQEGDFGVLPGHTPFFAGLRTGTMWYRQGQEKHFLAVSVGFAEVLPDRVTVLAQVAERAEDLDEARAEAGMARAAEMTQASPQQMELERARLASMVQTLQQLQAARRGR
jgi:F-type H+-transporting ATPase subunit epsilon